MDVVREVAYIFWNKSVPNANKGGRFGKKDENFAHAIWLAPYLNMWQLSVERSSGSCSNIGDCFEESDRAFESPFVRSFVRPVASVGLRLSKRGEGRRVGSGGRGGGVHKSATLRRGCRAYFLSRLKTLRYRYPGQI